jgi:hypothetical protein
MAEDKKLATEFEAREVAEQAREQDWGNRSFARAIFDGRLNVDLIDPLPEPNPDEESQTNKLLENLEVFARKHIDGDQVDRDGWVPEEVLTGLAGLGAFGALLPAHFCQHIRASVFRAHS